jgi:NADPH2:quinone reductase
VIRVVRSAVIDAPIGEVWAILRDFNSHTAWHPVVAESHIERGEASDQVGCVRNFTLRDGNHIREQLLTLSDRDHVSTYCILDATLPMRRYVATVTLKRVTDGDRTFWHWESTFDVPRGREREFADLVGGGVYEGGFAGLRAYLRRGGAAPRSGAAAAPMAARGIVVARHGGPEVLQPAALEAPPPGPGEVRLRHRAIGVNYIDVYVRTGLYPLLQPPAVPGMEAAGVVLDVGPGVHHLLPGDRVAYACPPPGAYVDLRTMAADQVVALPDDIDDDTAAASMLKGMTAEYLLHRTHRVRAGDTVLVHAAAGGVGVFLCAWAKALGARVLGTVSSDEKARIAREHGCDVTIVTREPRFAAAVREASGGRGADVIYDGLGAPARDENIAALATCGHWIVYGQAGGAHTALDADVLAAKSGTLSRPVLFHYTAQRPQLESIARNLFAALRNGTVRPRIAHRYPLAAAADAHRDLEARRTTGQLLLLP